MGFTRRLCPRCIPLRAACYAMAAFNLMSSGAALCWLTAVDVPVVPERLGGSWWNQVRAFWGPDSLITFGQSMYLLHGVLHSKRLALMLSLGAQLFELMWTVILCVTFVAGSPVVPKWLFGLLFGFAAIRVYFFALTYGMFASLGMPAAVLERRASQLLERLREKEAPK